MRAQTNALILRAAEVGISEPWKLGSRTPREIELIFRAHAARAQRRLEEIDLAAWLAGRYVAQGIHMPKRYPRRPDALRARPRRMSDAEIKRAFVAMGTEGRDVNGGR